MPQNLNRALCLGVIAGAFSAIAVTGCSTKNYVRNQTAPLVQKTNELDDATSTNTRNLRDVDQRAQAGIAKAQQSADTASQSAQAASQSATQAQQQAREAVNRADSLASVVSRLDTYRLVSDVAVLFAFNKADLTPDGETRLDQIGAQLGLSKSYILEVTGGTDSVGSAEYNYDLSQRRAAAVVQYLASKYNIPPHRFYLIGIGKDKEAASNSTAAGRALNRRVEVQVLSNDVTGALPPPPGPAVSQAR